MISIKSEEDLSKLEDGNEIKGTFPILKNSEIQFDGKNNTLYCEPGVTLNGSFLHFKASNSVIYLRRNTYEYKLGVYIHNDTVFYMGKNTYINQKMTVILSEQRHCFIGDNCMVSWGVCIRNSDPHLIYDCTTKKRKNPTKSVYIGDHVWIGQDSLMLKGTEIDSGSIIGGNSVVANKKIPNNTAWVGNPVKQITENIFWDKDCVHFWKEEDTALSDDYAKYIAKKHKDYKVDDWTYHYDKAEELSFTTIEKALNEAKSSSEKCKYLVELTETATKNRFVHLHPMKKKKWFGRTAVNEKYDKPTNK